ncbi:MAG: hypothetical protein LC118_07180 [Dehalococcoidia bacterium]|nr:hypothetical protein [Dehalococcoidia bacterium]
MTSDKTALGLGTALTTMHRTIEPRVRERLGIPETVQTAALIPVGWPKGKFGAGLRKPVIGTRWPRSWRANTCVAADCKQDAVRGRRPVIRRASPALVDAG